MLELLWGIFVFVLRAIYVVLEIATFVSDILHLGGWVKDKAIKVPAAPKILKPAAQRALDEAEARRAQAASGTVQAS